MTTCPECASANQYRRTKPEFAVGADYPRLLHGLGRNVLSHAKMNVLVCGDCGYIRLYAEVDARRRLADSSHWEPAR